MNIEIACYKDEPLAEAPWLDRHVDPLPKYGCIIVIKLQGDPQNHGYGTMPLLCEWEPYNPEMGLKAKGYLGSARIILGEGFGHEFSAWEQNNYEFVHYQIPNGVFAFGDEKCTILIDQMP
jgi:hypothetical protein